MKNYIRQKLLNFLNIDEVVREQIIEMFNDNDIRIRHIVGQAVSDACSGHRIETWGWGTSRPNLQGIVQDTTKKVTEEAVERTIKQATLGYISGEAFLDNIITRIKSKQLN